MGERMKRRGRLLALSLVVAGLAAGAAAPVLAQVGPSMLPFAALTGSNLSGTATLTESAGGGAGSTRIDVRLNSGSGDHPMHIHEGPCATVNPAPWYALHNVQQGTSGTDVTLTVAELTRAPKSILVHQSAQDIDTWVACADIVIPAVAAPAGAAPGPTVLPPGGEPVLSLRPVAAGLLFALGALGLAVRRRRPSRA
jgi:hypothetical protein